MYIRVLTKRQYERLSCFDKLKIYADIYGISYSKAKETLEYVGLGEAINKPASNLSKGMGARLRLARVFMHSPEIIFLDEPTSGLDPRSMKAIHKIILDKKKEGCTIFLTTHNMEEAAALCDTVALLNDGIIVDQGEPKEICRKYNNKKKIILHLLNGNVLFLGTTIITIAIFAIFFEWFPVYDVKAWIGFVLSFMICTFVSVTISRLEEQAENKKMEQALKRIEKEKRDIILKTPCRILSVYSN